MDNTTSTMSISELKSLIKAKDALIAAQAATIKQLTEYLLRCEQASRDEDIVRMMDAYRVEPPKFVPTQVDLVSAAPSHDLTREELEEMRREINSRK